MSWWTGISPFVSPVIAAFGSVGVAKLVLDSLAARLLERLKNRDSQDREGIAHERSMFLAERQNAFSMGTNSHVAAVAFDKYIEFCEEYVAALSKSLYALIEEGNKDQLLDARVLFDIRQKRAIWLSREIDDALDGFERDFTRSTVDAAFFDANTDPAPGPNELYGKQVIAALRKSLGTEEFAALRKDLLTRSLMTSPKAH
jgi:hypothetical protein